MSRPYVCPLCNGRGKVPNGDGCSTLCEAETPCLACNGRGIVWSPWPDPEPVPPQVTFKWTADSQDAPKDGGAA